MELNFKAWLVTERQDEGFLTALYAGTRAFCKELCSRPGEDFEKTIKAVRSETDALIALQTFYRKVAPRLDKTSKKRYEHRLKVRLGELGYDVQPDLLAASVEDLLTQKP